MGKILTFGEPLLAFNIPNQQNMIQSGGYTSFMSLAGSEINTCVALKRLGHEVTLLTVLPDNELGKYYKQILDSIGVETQYVFFIQGAMGTMYIKDDQVIYDRNNSAFYHMKCNIFSMQEIFKTRYDWIHLTGITPSLSENNIIVWKSIIDYGLKHSIPISLDLNYRPVLIEFNNLWKIIKPYLPFIEILFIAKSNIQSIHSIEKTTTITSLLEKTQLKQLLYCLKEIEPNQEQLRSSILFTIKKKYQSTSIKEIVIEPIGGGDTYSAGFIDATLTKKYSIYNKLHYCDLLTIQSQKHRGHFLPPTNAEKNSP